MKKVISVAVCIFILSISLIGCKNSKRSNRFIVIEKCHEYEIYADTATGVQYLCTHSKFGTESLSSVLLDADGKPLLYKESEE